MIAVGVAEVALRLVGYQIPLFYTLDEHRGWALRPGAEGWWRDEGRAYVRINEDGLRDRDYARVKPPGTFRVAVLGDSFAAAFQVPAELAFWSVAERELASCAALDAEVVEVVNFGVANYGTVHEVLTWRHHARFYSPDLVLLAMFTGNDVYNNGPAFNRNDPGPRFELRGDALVLDDSFRDTARYRLRGSLLGKAYEGLSSHSRVAQLVNRARGAIRRLRHRRRVEGHGPEGAEAGVSFAIYREPDDPRWREAWKVTERLVVRLHEEVEAAGSSLLVVTLSNPEQVWPGPEERARRAAARGVDDLFYPDRRIRALGRRHGIPVLGLARPLQEYADETGTFLHGFDGPGYGHWNPEGHRLAGETIAEFVCERSKSTEAPSEATPDLLRFEGDPDGLVRRSVSGGHLHGRRSDPERVREKLHDGGVRPSAFRGRRHGEPEGAGAHALQRVLPSARLHP